MLVLEARRNSQLAGAKESNMLATVKSAKAALDQIVNYFSAEITSGRTASLGDGMSIRVSTVARRNTNGGMSIRVHVLLDGWSPSTPAHTEDVVFEGSSDIQVDEDGFVNPEAVLAEIAKVVDSIPTDYHYYMD